MGILSFFLKDRKKEWLEMSRSAAVDAAIYQELAGHFFSSHAQGDVMNPTYQGLCCLYMMYDNAAKACCYKAEDCDWGYEFHRSRVAILYRDFKQESEPVFNYFREARINSDLDLSVLKVIVKEVFRGG